MTREEQYLHALFLRSLGLFSDALNAEDKFSRRLPDGEQFVIEPEALRPPRYEPPAPG